MDRTLSHHSSQENGFGVFVPQRRPLYKEVVGYRIQDLPSERQRLDTANTLSVNYQDFLYSQNSKEESCYTQGNAGPRAVTQHLKTQTGGAGTHPWKEVILYICYKTVSCDKDWLKGHSGSVHVHSLSSQDASDMQRSSLCSHTVTSPPQVLQ